MVEDFVDCWRCGESVFFFFRYCSSCGIENTHFQKEEFIRQMGESPFEVRIRECEANHPELRTDEARDSSFYAQHPFCPYCGQRLFSS